MEEQQRRKVAAMLEFYEDLGIEEFYIGRAEVKTAIPASKPVPAMDAPVRSTSTQEAPDARLHPPRVVFGKPPAELYNDAAASQTVAAPGPVAQSMSLFESPSPGTTPRENETLEQI